MSWDELRALKVVTTTKQERDLWGTPAAVSVITRNDIERSGATSIPELLRQVPGLNVARINKNKWSVSIRGFPTRFNDKLLVLIDGRAVYRPMFGGTFWSEVDYPLSQIERIEVVRGPGGTIWGTNATNGVINIITRKAHDALGTGFEVALGLENRLNLTLHRGYRLSRYNDAALRFYVNTDVWDDGDLNLTTPTVLTDPNDDWWSTQAGFRFDNRWGSGDSLSLNGNYRFTRTNDVLNPYQVTGLPFSHQGTTHAFNLTGGWVHRTDAGSQLAVNAYYDLRANDDNEVLARSTTHTFDVDTQWQLPSWNVHRFTVGLGYRVFFDDSGVGGFQAFVPANRTLQWFTGFIMDEISLFDDHLLFVPGIKFEHNTYSEFEFQPSLRALLRLNDSWSVWTSFSRSVRVPHRAEEALVLSSPTVVRFQGAAIDPEVLYAYEAGIKTQIAEKTTIDVAGYIQDYKKLRQFVSQDLTAGVFPLVAANNYEGTAYGVEASVVTQLTSWWRMKANYTYFKMNVSFIDPSLVSPLNADRNLANRRDWPGHMFYWANHINFFEKAEFDATLRFVDGFSGRSIPSYLVADFRLAYRLSDRVKASVVAQNLFDQHQEFDNVPGTNRQYSLVEANVYAQFNVEF